MKYQDISILLVDDDQIDVLAVKSALEESGIANPVYTAQDGIAALNLLRGTNGVQQIARPYIILLDLNMPRMNGLEFLKAIRDDKYLRQSIVFVLTTSKDDRDKTAAYDHNIAGYMVKSEVGADFINLVKLLKDFKIVIQFPLHGADSTEI